MGMVYCATNKINGKQYVGQTIQTLKRRKQLHYDFAFKYNSDSYFHNTLRKYGKEAFRWEVLEETNNLNEREQYWISKLDTYNNGYNSTEGGSKHFAICREVRQKMSEAHKGNKYPKISEASKGRQLTEETKQKMSKAHKGKKLTEETKRKLSEAFKGEKNPMYGRTGEKHPMYGKKGINNPNSKLTEEKVRAIRADNRTLKEIAEEYGVGTYCIGAIKRRERYQNIE